MLDCKRDRLDYGQLLRPPTGYKLDRAVATTYSADLGTLLSIPVALVYAQTLEGDLTGTRFELLEAIKQFSRQVKVYHQKGQIHVPEKLNWLHAHLEDMLVPILPKKAFSAFHPKIWLIRYCPREEQSEMPGCYRLIVLSRNLTFDRSWDVAASLDGTIRQRPQKENQPLVDFIDWLHRQNPLPNAEGFLSELSRVEFTTPPPFNSHAFHPMGIDGHRQPPISLEECWRSLVISPFLHEEALRRISENTRGKLRLLSNRRELEKLGTDILEQTDKMVCYQLSDIIVDSERQANAEEGVGQAMEQNLHAKLFIFERKQGTKWFLGSANATKAALNDNIEFMLELAGKGRKTRIEQQMAQLVGDEDSPGPFEAFDPASGGIDDKEERAKQKQAREFEHALLKAPIRGSLDAAENGNNYDLEVNLDLRSVPKRAGITISIKPLSGKSVEPSNVHPGKTESCVFPNLAEVEISRFLHIRIHGPEGLVHEFLMRIEIDGLPADRLENILRKIIDSSDKFFDYLRFLLADEINKEDLIGTAEALANPQKANQQEEGWHFHLPIYEQLLVIASRAPRKLAEVDEIIQHLTSDKSKPIIPDDFLVFWDAFRQSIPAETQPSKMS